jgi:hypothetical protein
MITSATHERLGSRLRQLRTEFALRYPAGPGISWADQIWSHPCILPPSGVSESPRFGFVAIQGSYRYSIVTLQDHPAQTRHTGPLWAILVSSSVRN